jgi:hypothetical protein
MAVSKQEVVLTFDVDTGQATATVKKLQDSMEGVADAANDAAEATEEIGDNAKKSGGLLKKAGKLGADGFKLVGAAIAATGLIGLVTKVLEPIIAAFLENKTVAGALSAAMAGLGAVIDTIVSLGEKLVGVLVDAFNNPQEAIKSLKDAIVNNIETRIEGLLNLLPRLGEAIKAAFRGDFAEAGKIAVDAVGQVALGVENVTDVVAEATEQLVEYVVETGKAAVEATKLDMALGSLADRERDLAVLTAQSAAEVEELKRQRDDERLSIEERIAAAEAAAAIDQRIANENVRIQEEKAALLRQELELQGETEERLDALAEAEIAAADARAASAGVQTELMTSIYGLNQELIDQEAEKAQLAREAAEEIAAAQQELEDELYALSLSKREREELAAMQEYDRRVAMAGDDEGLIKAATEQLNADLQAIDDSYREQQRAADEQDRLEKLEQNKARLQMASNALGALAALNDAFAKDDEASAEKAFKRNKALALATAVVNTGQAVVNALTAGGNPLKIATGAQFVEAGIAAAVGAAQVATIARSKYQAAGGGGGQTETNVPTPGGGGGGGGGTIGAPTLDLGFLGAGAGQQEPIRAYVLAENVSTAQQANQKIQDQATL